MRPLKVLLVIDHAGSLGGAERFVTGLALHLPRDRVEPWVCSTRSGDPSAVQALGEAGIPHIGLGRSAKLDVHRLAPLFGLLRRERFDVLHAHKFGSNIWCTMIGRAARVPVVLAHEHNWSYTGDRLRVLLDGQLVGRLCSRFVAVSEANRRAMTSLEKIAPEKIVVLPTGYIPHQRERMGNIKAELGLADEQPSIGVAAGLRPEKALDVMLRAHALVAGRLAGTQLLLAGAGPCEAELRNLAAELGTQDSVHFLGMRRDVDEILARVDLGAMSSDWEGMPLMIFECMAAGTPLVATAVGGIPEVVIDGSTGLLVGPRDANALADALTKVLSDGALRERLATNAAARLPQFTIDAVAERFAELYEGLIAAGNHR